MAKGASARAAARRQKDKWKAKRWFSIRAPRNPWSFKVIGETIAEDESMLVDRPYEVMQNELDGDFSKMHVKIKFRIKDVVGNDALTEFVGHDVMKDFVRRQIRRDRGKVDDTIDVVTDDGYFIRIKPFIVTRSRVKGSQKQETRSVARNEVITFCAKTTWIGVQQALLDGSLEEKVTKAVSKIQPVRAVFFRKSQLIQDGVVIDDGPTLEEVKAAEKASIEAANQSSEDVVIEPGESDEETVDVAEIGDDEISDDSLAHEENESEEPSEEAGEPTSDFESMTVVQLKELLKKAGKPVSGKKADLVARLSE
ncbi:MAG: SAP domain-containing protein [Candidatus Thalassarchaeaceae archaeon]|jgi:small subunit ribosomal protein S3Ae|nr:SAP domain-containing protein [Candidatus Thalassarchaeaceae archaeon]MEE2630075.1 SAP domain-containing protein [Candidatus Thermoplasmatota archaeon]